jgi:hypothetical protein
MLSCVWHFYFFQQIADEYLQLDRLSTFKRTQLQRPSNYELISHDIHPRYAVSSCPLFSDQASEWAVDVIQLGHLYVGIIADNSITMNRGKYNINHPSYCAWYCYSAGDAYISANGSGAENADMNVEIGDVMLFRFDPLVRQLRMMNFRTRKSVIVRNVNEKAEHPDAPMYITAYLCDHNNGSSSHIRFRLMTPAEQIHFQESHQ